MSREHKVNTGYDLAARLIEKHNGDLNAMIELAGRRETSWLEFKADPFCRTGENGERQEDYSWHILKAVVAFANTCGGAVIIGADDSGKSVPLRDKDSGEVTGNLDKYLRDLDAVLFKRDQFTVRNENEKNPNRAKIEIDVRRCRDLVEIEPRKLDGQTVIVLLVREKEPSDDLLVYKNNGDEIALVRDLQMGKNRQLTVSETAKYPNNRPELQPLRDYYNSIPDPNDCFVGRQAELEELHRLLSEIPPRIPLIHGPGGTGKTELAFRYAEIYGEEYEACIYLRAENISSIPEGFVQMLLDPQLTAKYRLEIPEDVIRTEDRFRIIRDNLLQNSKRDILILFDNLENPGVLNPSEVRKYLMVPEWEKLHLYATTRLDNLQVTENDTVYPFKLAGLPESDGLELLKKKRPFGNEAEETAAGELVEYLDGNAWALDFIGEDLKQRHPKYDDDYQVWLDVIRKEPLKAFSEAAEQETVRIKHGCLDPVKLLEPTLNRLGSVARSFANTAALCNPDFIYTGWLKGVYQRKTRKDIPVRQFDKAIAELKDSHVFNQRTEEDKAKTALHSGEQETFEVIKLHRLTRSVLRSLLGDDLKKELLVFRKYFLRELLNVLHAGDQKYQGIADTMPTSCLAGEAGSGAAFFCGGFLGNISTAADWIASKFITEKGKTAEKKYSHSRQHFFAATPLPESSAMLSKAISLGSFEQGSGTKYSAIFSEMPKSAMVGGLAGYIFGPVGGFVGSAIGKAVEFYSSQTKSSTKEEKAEPVEAERGPESLQSRIDQVRAEISPSPEWIQTIRLFLFSFEEIRDDLDADDIQCVREFLNICCNKLSDLRIFSALHDQKKEALGVELLFRLYPVVTKTLKTFEAEEEYLAAAAVLYNYLVNYWQLAENPSEERPRLEACLKFFIEQVQKWPEKHQQKLDRELDEIGPAAGKKFKSLSQVHFPRPVFCEKI